MNIEADIYPIYHAAVTVPDAVHEKYGHTREYEQHSLAASHLVELSGTDAYSEVVEWGEAPTREACEAFVASWTEFLGALTC
jgi:hypothetical protein